MKEKSPGSVSEKEKYVDLTYLRRRTKADPGLMSEMISLYLGQTTSLIKEMRASAESKDWKTLQSVAHKMIPSFSIVGIGKQYKNAAKTLQESARTGHDQDEIGALVLTLEHVLGQACGELETQLRLINTESMNAENRIKLFLVDDDVVFLKSLELEFRERGNFDIETYVSGERCVENLSNKPDIIILDYLLDGTDKSGMDGIATLDKIKAFSADIPVIMLSAQDKIDVAINCMHHKAFDYVVKSETAFLRLQKIITSVFHLRKIEKELVWYMERM